MPLNARLHIETALSGGRTVLRNSYCTQPFRLVNITEDRSKGDLHLMIMSSSPGVLEGDRYQLSIHLSKGSNTVLHTQAYQRLYQMKEGATQTVEVRMAKGSAFTYLPHPIVPHQGSVFYAKNTLVLEEGCTLLWGEVVSCGRKLNGEVFQLSSYHGLTEIFQNGKLVVKENLYINPAETAMHSLGQMEGYTHQATLIYLNEKAPLPAVTKTLLDLLQAQEGITTGVSTLPVAGLVVRVLGHKAEQLFDLQQQIASVLHMPQSVNAKTVNVHVSRT